MTTRVKKFLQKLMRAPILFYRWFIRPVLGNHCRFYPSCSQYALDAIDQHGCAKGAWLALQRILRCHPWHEGGIDPVPELNQRGTQQDTC